jgi:hypothetical protein
MSISFDSPGVDIYEFDIQEPSPFALNKEESNPDDICEFKPEQFITHEFEPEQKQVFIKDIENDCNYVDDVNGDEIDDVNIDEIDDVNGNEIDDIDGNEIDNVNASKPKQNIQFDPPQPSYKQRAIQRFLEKRKKYVYNRPTIYKSRSDFAKSRIRSGGKFISDVNRPPTQARAKKLRRLITRFKRQFKTYQSETVCDSLFQHLDSL